MFLKKDVGYVKNMLTIKHMLTIKNYHGHGKSCINLGRYRPADRQIGLEIQRRFLMITDLTLANWG